MAGMYLTNKWDSIVTDWSGPIPTQYIPIQMADYGTYIACGVFGGTMGAGCSIFMGYDLVPAVGLWVAIGLLCAWLINTFGASKSGASKKSRDKFETPIATTATPFMQT